MNYDTIGANLRKNTCFNVLNIKLGASKLPRDGIVRWKYVVCVDDTTTSGISVFSSLNTSTGKQLVQ